VGNRTQQTQNGVARTSTYNKLNQLLSESSPSVTYAYEATGNRIKRQSATLTETLGYDFDNRLKTYTAGATSASYTSNGLGERVSKTVGGVTTTSYQDGPEVVLEKTGATSVFSLHGPGIDDLIARRVGTTWTYYHQDGLGSVAALTDSTGVVLRSYAYEPFGTIRKTTGTTGNAWTFTGRPLDAESGVLFLRNRYYDPRTGTFLQQDPIGVAGGVNLYAYVRNNPLNWVDPFGLERIQAIDQQTAWVAEAIARISASEAIGATALGISYAGMQLMQIPHPATKILGAGLEAIAAGLEAVAIDLLPIPGLRIPIIPDNDPGE